MKNQNSQLIVLNRPRRNRRGLTISKDGRFFLRTQIIRLLGLHAGDGVVFVYSEGQMYMVKSSTLPDPIILSGRDGQLHGNSVATAKHLLLFIEGAIKNCSEVDLVVGDKTVSLTIDGKMYDAAVIITRTDISHCR